MLQPAMVKDILDQIGQGEYVGTPLGNLYTRFIGKNVQAAEENDYFKFVYHMDELYDAGLFKTRDLDPHRRWGQSGAIGRVRGYTNVTLILTPLGAEVLKELKKPKGLDRLIQGIRSTGAVGGQEALRYALGELFKGIGS